MFPNKLLKTDELEIEGRAYSVAYYETQTPRGTLRYSSDVVLGPADRIILDGSSLSELESKVVRLVPTTIYSRMLNARAA
jgi:hypothetical protein